MLNVLYTVIIYPLIQIIEFVFVFSQKLFKNTGISIFFISCTFTVLCLPLYIVAEKWQQIERNTIKRLKPKIDIIKNAFKGDEQYLLLTTFYRQNHYHPIYALRSTFGLLIQIPFFIAAYAYLSHLDVLKNSSFLFIRDLGSPDSLIPIFGGLNLLPILMTLINLVSVVIYTNSFDLKDKIQLYLISLVFLVLLYNSPSGLVLYWTLNNLFSLIKNIYIKIPAKEKRTILFCLISLFCFFIIFYVMFILRRDIQIKLIMSFLFLLIAIFPWIFPLIKKTASSVHFADYSNNNSLLIFLFSFLSIAVLCGIFIPSMLIGSSVQEFSNIDSYQNPLFFIFNCVSQTLGFFVFWPVCLYFLFSSEIKKAFLIFGVIILIMSICNVFIFSGNYGIISIELIFDSGVSHNFKEILFNIFIIIVISLPVFFILFKIGAKAVLPLVVLIFISVSAGSVINIRNINNEYNLTKEFAGNKKEIIAIEPLFNLSKTGKNTVIIMLDRATSGFFPYILDESPDLLDIYSGFVYYPNTVSFSGYTRLGAPPLFGGYEYTPTGFNKRENIPMREKHNEAILLLPRIFSEANYEVVITDPPYPNYSYKDDLRIYDQYKDINAYITIGKYTDYWLKEHDFNLPSISDTLKRNMFWYSIFKIMPLAFRSGIYQHGGWFAPFSGYKFITNLNSYSVLDYLPRLTGFSCKKENSFLFLVNETTHSALHYQAPDYRPSIFVTDYGTSPYSKENEYHTNIGAVKRLGDWFEFLKSENLYDNTRIIIVSDHGSQLNYVLKTELSFNLDNFNPLLLYKDFNSNESLKTNMDFMSNADVPFLALENQIENAVNPWTKNIISNSDKLKPLYIALSGGVHLENPDNATVKLNKHLDYYVHDNIFIYNNWVKADN